ncbi:hypothetical protein ANN_27428 [Periplaneta americana]|uniref:Uncharacterized protein n=1 Tax=Periplaneta americana TaxID=6978 RepID=A0ABQ8RVQ3_PERAM|nr:hypothetical protein ANN_27428 [Periplaneta americana]
MEDWRKVFSMQLFIKDSISGRFSDGVDRHHFDCTNEPCFVEDGFLTAHRYIEEILGQHVLPFASFIGDNFVLLQDNTRPRMVRYVLQYLNEVGIQLMQWPSRSLNLNPIDHLKRNALAMKIAAKVPFDAILDELRENICSSLERVQLVTRKDLQNIEAAFSLTSGERRHRDDGTMPVCTILD